MGFWRQRLRRHPTRVLVGGFAAAILVGALLLTLPVSSVGARIGLLDALFTATSAVCVTGLTVRDTGKEFSTFGHVVILVLIQLGGLGITTLSTALFLVFGQRGVPVDVRPGREQLPSASRGQAHIPLGPGVRFDRRD